MNKYIIFSGMDGTGKSTHAKYVNYFYKLHGINVNYIWMRGKGRIILSLILLSMCKILRITKYHRLDNGKFVAIYNFHNYKPLRFIWPIFQFFDSYIYWKIILPIYTFFRNELLIIDRCPIDTYVDIIYDTKTFSNNLLFFFIKLIPDPLKVVIFDLNEEVAYKRKDDILNINHLMGRRKIYTKIAHQYQLDIFSTEKSFDLTSSYLLKILVKKGFT